MRGGAEMDQEAGAALLKYVLLKYNEERQSCTLLYNLQKISSVELLVAHGAKVSRGRPTVMSVSAATSEGP